MKPDWKNAPSWAEYMAMDADGSWWWFENKPAYSRGEWMPKMGGGDWQSAGCSSNSAKDSLEGRP